MAGEFFSQFRSVSTDWMAGAFVGATLDFCFGLLKSKSHILNLISSFLQLTCATFICHEVLYGFGLRRGTNTLQSTWVLWFAVWTMSPNATKKLSSAYYAFHKLLYGTRSLVPDIPELPEIPPGIKDRLPKPPAKKECSC